MRTLVAMSGGVDSSTVAAMLTEAGDDVTGVTILLWGGDRVGRSCSTADTDAAEAAARTLGVPHVTLDRRSHFEQVVLDEFAQAATTGRTLNPCVACNMKIKWDALLSYATLEGFDRVATGHYARVLNTTRGARIQRAVDITKDQSYVLWGTTPAQAARFVFPLGHMTKTETRAQAQRFGLDAATAPDSMDLCFDRAEVIAARHPIRHLPVVTATGTVVGETPVELVTVGQRKGLPATGANTRSYVTGITATEVTLGSLDDLMVEVTALDEMVLHSPAAGRVMAQTSAHGTPQSGHLVGNRVVWDTRQRRVAPGQVVVLYDDNGVVLGGGTAT